MLIDIRDIRKSRDAKRSYSFAESFEISEYDLQVTPFFSVTADFTDTGKSFLISGKLEAEAKIECCRCLDYFPFKIQTMFNEEFFPAVQNKESSHKKLNSEGLDRFYYTGNIIDLKDMIRQIFIASLPFSPVCREDCRGLCGLCGANLNEVSPDRTNPDKIECQCVAKKFN